MPVLDGKERSLINAVREFIRPTKKTRQGFARRLNRMPFLAPFIVALSILLNFISLVQPNYDYNDIIKSSIYLFLMVVITVIISYISFKDKKSGSFFAILLIITLTYFDLLQAKFLFIIKNSPLSFLARALPVIIMMASIFSFLCFIFHKYIAQKRRAIFLTNMACIVMVVLPLIQMFISSSKWRYYVLGDCQAMETSTMVKTVENNQPDIYFIIMDSYTSKNSLKTYWNYDNSPFLSFLETNGFFVAYESRAEFPMTHWSIASTLNMCEDYNAGAGLYSENAAFKIIKQSKTIKLLSEKGYDIINYSIFQIKDIPRLYRVKNFSAGTWQNIWDVSILNFVCKILLRPHYGLSADYYTFYNHQIFDLLKMIPEEKSNTPKFIYAHFMLPHNPFCLNEYGLRNDTEKEKINELEAYLEQVKYANKLLIQIIKKIERKRNSIVIIQGDHGSRLFNSTNNIHDESYTILNALHLPGSDPSWFWEGMRPVDTFRLVFNKYFGANYPYLSKTNQTSQAETGHSTAADK